MGAFHNVVVAVQSMVKLFIPVVKDQQCYVFLTYCARNGLSLGPSSLLRHTLPSRTDYDSYTSFC
jgi:hypothetical protein